MVTKPTQDQTYELFQELISNLKLGTDNEGRPYALVVKESCNPRAILLVDTLSVRRLITQRAKERNLILTSRQMDELQKELVAYAEGSGEKFNVSMRIKTTKTGVEIDVGNERQQVIKLSDGSVSVLDSGADAIFYLPAAALPFVLPSEVGDLDLLFPYINMEEIDIWILIALLAYILSTARDDNSPYPILVLIAGQGCAKTTTCKLIIRSLVDPSTMGVQGFPKNRQDMVLASNHCHVLCYDNLRRLSEAWSDTLCIASTGGNDPTRKLYSDSTLVNHTIKVPLVLNGIHDFVTEPDLAQRCVRLELKPIPESERRDEKNLTEEFNRDLPHIFRGLLDLTAQILNCLDEVEVTHPQRMHRFVKYLAAIEHIYGWPQSLLQEHYAGILKQAQSDAVLDDPLASAFCEFVSDNHKSHLEFTPSQLLNELRHSLRPSDPRLRQLPQSPISLSKRLAALKTALASQDIEVTFTRGKERRITITNGDLY